MDFENLTFKCIKGVAIDTVVTRTLSEIGFPIDFPRGTSTSFKTFGLSYASFTSKIEKSPYQNIEEIEKLYIYNLITLKNNEKALELTLSKLTPYDISKEEFLALLDSDFLLSLNGNTAEILIEEFVFIIEKLLPRNICDIYYSFDLEPHPAYDIFFSIAAEKMKIHKPMDPNDVYYGQYIDHTVAGVKERIIKGETLQDIYEKTCATKEIIKNAVYDIPHNHYISIECALFSLSRKYRYQKNEAFLNKRLTFSLYKSDEKILNIVYLSREEMKNICDYDKYFANLSFNDAPVLVLDFYELNYEYASSIIRKAINDFRYIENHSKERSKYIEYEKVLEFCDNNYVCSKKARKCGCFLCGNIFSSQEISKWFFYDDEKKEGYAYCPNCENASVIMDSFGCDITTSYLDELGKYADEHNKFVL